MASDIRILIADDHPVFRFGLRALLNAMPDTTVVGEVTTGEEVIALAGSVQPDVILMDINMPGVNGIEATRRIRETQPEVRVLMVTMLEDDSVFAAMRAGARGYVVKGAEPAEVLRAIRAVAAGDAIFSPGIAERLIHYFATPAAAAPRFPELSDREREVLQYVARGHTYREIGERLYMAEKTASVHVSRILAKLDVRSRTEAAAVALRQGLAETGTPV